MSYCKRLEIIGELAQTGTVKDVQQNLLDLKNKSDAAKKLLNLLEIPYDALGMVDHIDLYEIFMDEKKFKDIIAKLNNKAFW